MIVNIVGWSILIASWIIPKFIKDKIDKHVCSMVLSALATGIFVGALLAKYTSL